MRVLRMLALILVFPGIGLVVLALSLGLIHGGLWWLLTAVVALLGCLWVSIPIRFMRKPTVGVALDVLGVFSFFVFGAVGSALRKTSPDVWGLTRLLGIEVKDAELVRFSIALLVAWVIHRVLKRYLVEAAFVSDRLSSAS